MFRIKPILTIIFMALFSVYFYAQSPVTPSDGATSVLVTTNSVTWTDFDDGNGNGPYDVEFDDDATFASPNASATNTSATSLAISVDNNTTYYWRVRDTDIDGSGTDGSWHSYSFTTELATPSLVDPSGTYSSTTTFNWNMSGNYSNVDFDVVVATDNAFTNVVGNSSVSGVLTTTISLPSAGDYYWKVTATVNDATAPNNGESKVSSTGSFTLTIPGPTLTGPVNGLTGVSIEPTMSWHAVSGAVSYKLYVDDASDFATPIYAEDQGTNLSKAFTEADNNFPLDNGTTYYWRVASVDNVGHEYYSSTYHFTTFPDVTPTLTNPADGATVYVSPVLLGWTINQSVGTLQFKLQYQETDQSDNTPPTVSEWAAATSVTTSNLYYSLSVNGGKRYYWRVIVLNASGEIEDYSSTYYFDTYGGATVTVYPSYPIGGTTVYTNSPTLYWYVDQYDAGVTYQIRYATNNSVDANGQLNDASAVSEPTDADISNATSAMYHSLSGLTPGTTYYWEVRAYYAATGEFGDWSTVESFTTHGSGTLVVPIVSYPTGGVTVYTTSPYLYWYISESGSGLTYDVQVDDDNSFASPEYSGSTTSNVTFIQASGLTAGTTYYWRVRSNNGSSQSAWSNPIGTFVIAGGVLNGYPVATYPTNNPIVYTNQPTLYWYLEGSSLGLTKYVVCWKEGSTSSNWLTDNDGSAEITNLNTTYYTFTTSLTYGSTYYWAVASFDGSSYSAWSEGSFTVVGPSTEGTPILSTPEDGAIVYDNDVTLYWYVNGSTTGIQNYEITYSTSDVFDPSVTTTTTSSSNSLSLTGLTPGATYYWKVRSYYGGSTYSGYSSTFHFTINPGSNPVTPLPGSPNNVTITETSPVFSWVLPAQPDVSLNYVLEYSTNEDFSDAVVITDLSNPYTQINGLELNSEYYWRVKSYTQSGESYYSPVGRFTTYDPTSVESGKLIPDKFEISQNYPNPFNPTTTIKFQLPEQTFVTLKIYDITGKEVKTLVSSDLSAGYYSIVWNATDNNGNKVSSGIYFYRITAGNFVAVKKLMLLK